MRPGEHRGVRRRSAARRRDPERRLRVQSRGVGGCEVLRHQDPRGLQVGAGDRQAQHVRQDLGAHAPQVRRARPQVLVVQAVPGRRGLVDRRRARPGRQCACRRGSSAGAGASSASSRRNSRCASKIAAWASPARAATWSRWARMSTAVSPIARSRAASSAAGSLAATSGISGSSTWKRRAAPERDARARPRTPARSRRSAGSSEPGRIRHAGRGLDLGLGSLVEVAVRERAQRLDRLGRLGPDARTSISWSRATPSVATPFRLAASAGPRPFVRSRTLTRASNPEAVWTNRAAGRACRP